MSTISFEIPDEVYAVLARLGVDPLHAAKEALLVDLFRRRVISVLDLRLGLGLERMQVDEVLDRHDVPVDRSMSSRSKQLRCESSCREVLAFAGMLSWAQGASRDLTAR